ncbi:MAG: hypothetical protein CR968_05400 [Flavobacteriia bacterium]|nr:MAG: hypothetical protein CR968_05400 [Flavobacteriia bacterium]
MKEYKTIDRIFQERFRDYEVLPSEKVWDNIQAKLNDKPVRKRRFTWLWFGSIAAGLALLFVFNNPFQSPGKNQSIETMELPIVFDYATENTTTEIAVQETSKETTIPVNKRSEVAEQFSKPVRIPITLSNNNFNDKMSLSSLNNNDTAPSSNTNSKSEGKENLTDYVSDKPMDVSEKQTHKKWTVTTLAAPVLLSSFNNLSSLDPAMDDLAKQSKLSTSYGVQVAYKFNKKFSIQSGIHMVDFAYITNDIPLYQNGLMAAIANVNYVNKPIGEAVAGQTTQPQTIYSTPSEKDLNTGSLTQVFGYVEIPIEAKYQLTGEQHSFGLNLIGGFSTLLLNKNELLVETSNFTEKLGEASNLNPVNFSGNLGLEFEYKVYKNVNFNMVPMFKVQTHTLQNKNTFKPYSVGIYSGLNLRF